MHGPINIKKKNCFKRLCMGSYIRYIVDEDVTLNVSLYDLSITF